MCLVCCWKARTDQPCVTDKHGPVGSVRPRHGRSAVDDWLPPPEDHLQPDGVECRGEVYRGHATAAGVSRRTQNTVRKLNTSFVHHLIHSNQMMVYSGTLLIWTWRYRNTTLFRWLIISSKALRRWIISVTNMPRTRNLKRRCNPCWYWILSKPDIY